MFGQHDSAAPAGTNDGQQMTDNLPPADNAGSPQDTPSDTGTPLDNPAPVQDDTSMPHDEPTGDDSTDLLGLKHQALQQLAPLVSHLDQNPEEKFRTTMMMIQASDNADLLKDAYEAASAIPDEKAKAQALLDVVNEINYFTQPHHDEE